MARGQWAPPKANNQIPRPCANPPPPPPLGLPALIETADAPVHGLQMPSHMGIRGNTRADRLADVCRRKSPLLFGRLSVSHVGRTKQPEDSEERLEIGLMDRPWANQNFSVAPLAPIRSGHKSQVLFGASKTSAPPEGGGGGNYWAPLTRRRHTTPHSAQPQHTNYWAPRTRKRHQQEHRPQRPTERSDPTQHAK